MVPSASRALLPAMIAYVDPGAGSFVFQVIIGAFLGAAVALRAFGKRIRGFFTRKASENDREALHPRGRE